MLFEIFTREGREEKGGVMLGDVHEGLDFPLEVVDSATVRGKYEFYHYSVDGIDDRVSVLDN